MKDGAKIKDHVKDTRKKLSLYRPELQGCGVGT
jgi:hypothetical protein